MNVLLRAVSSGDVATVRSVLERQPELVNSRESTSPNKTVLHIAAERGDLAIVILLLESDADLNVQDAAGDTPLHLAVRAGAFEVVDRLLDLAADARCKNNEGYDAFSTAVAGANTTMVDTLRRHCFPGRYQ